MSYVMQARSSATGLMVTWVTDAPDWDGAAYDGDGDPEEIAALQIFGNGNGNGATGATGPTGPTGDVEVPGTLGQILTSDGDGGITATPAAASIGTTRVVANADPCVRIESFVGHVTTTDDEGVSIDLVTAESAPDPSGILISVVVTALLHGEEVDSASFVLRGTGARDGDLIYWTAGSTEDPSPQVGEALEGLEVGISMAGVGEGEGASKFSLQLSGLDEKTITWSWEARVQYTMPEPP